MTALEVDYGLDRFGRWLWRRPGGKLALTVFLSLFLAGCAWWDEHVRARGVGFPLATDREDFLFSLWFGAAIGLMAILADLLHSLARRFTRLFRVSQKHEQPQQKRVNLGAVWATGWSVLCLALLFAWFAWGAFHGVFRFHAMIATLAVVIPGSLLLDLIFGVERLEEPAQAVPAGT